MSDVREGIAREIEAAFTEWVEMGDERPPFGLHSEAWLVERTFARAAAIARNYPSDAAEKAEEGRR